MARPTKILFLSIKFGIKTKRYEKAVNSQSKYFAWEYSKRMFYFQKELNILHHRILYYGKAKPKKEKGRF